MNIVQILTSINMAAKVYFKNNKPKPKDPEFAKKFGRNDPVIGYRYWKYSRNNSKSIELIYWDQTNDENTKHNVLKVKIDDLENGRIIRKSS